MTDSSVTRKRPGSVTLVTIYLWVIALVSLVVGVALLIGQTSDDFVTRSGRTSGDLITIAIIELVVGLLVVWTAVSLGRGSDVARSVVAAVMIIRIVATVTIVVWSYTSGYLLAGVLSVLLPVFILWALYGNPRADEWFDA